MNFKDGKNSLTKPHHHAGFEVHIVTEGHYIYHTDDASMRVEAGELLILSPLVRHYSPYDSEGAEKFTLTYTVLKNSKIFASAEAPPYKHMKAPAQMLDAIKTIQAEKKLSSYLSNDIIENRVFECIVYLMRNFIAQPNGRRYEDDEGMDARVLLAKQYINDNINRAVSVSEVSAYCCISPRQLARLFLAHENTPIAEYIRHRRCIHIEHLLAETALSLKKISEAMDFNNEYYFNTFFKKHSGMTPGTYRKSLQKSE